MNTSTPMDIRLLIDLMTHLASECGHYGALARYAQGYEKASAQARCDAARELLRRVTFERFKIEVDTMLEAGLVGHVTSGHPSSPEMLNVYRKDPSSPTGVFGCASIHDSAEARAFLRERGLDQVCKGGMSGQGGGSFYGGAR